MSGRSPDVPDAYHPSSAFRRALRRASPRTSHGSRGAAASSGAPGLADLVGAALAVGVASGFLELAVVMFQVHWLHRVGLGTLRISRHVAWMIPAAETPVVLALALGLVAPVLVWSARRRGRPGHGQSVAWAWRWTSFVLGTLLLLGPLLAVRRLHVVAALVLSVGLGSRIGPLLVRPTPRWRRGARLAGAVALVGLVGYAFWQWDRVARAEEAAWSRPASRAPNLLWIVMDTVRADHMSLYGYGRRTTPELERRAGDGITFEMARSAAPFTLPSHVTMFTGLWPFEHGARIDRPYCGPSPTLAEHLAARGYTTAGLAGNTGMCNATYGVGRGFDYYVELLCNHEVSARAAMFNASLGGSVMKLANAIRLPVPAEFPQPRRRLAPELIGHAEQWLGRVRGRNEAGGPGSHRPYFLFMNFMDVHSPYIPLAGARRFWTDPVPPRKQAVPENGWDALRARNEAAPERRPERQRELDAVTRRLVDLYDDCLLGLDAELGRFLGGLRADGLLDEAWVVITSDHGEEFGEHGIFGHGASLYDQVTHVPLILIPPMAQCGSGDDPYAALRGRRIGVPVSHRDLPATMAGLLLPGAPNPFPGRSLARHWADGGPGSPDPILAQMEEQHFVGDEVQMNSSLKMDSVVAEGHLFIESIRNAAELYDLSTDRENRWNLAARPEQGDRRGRLKQTLDALRHPADRVAP
jgi:arylsulfatase A-like enzyme